MIKQIYLYQIYMLNQCSHQMIQLLFRIYYTQLQKQYGETYKYQSMSEQRKAVEIYLRVRGPPNPLIQPQFKIQGSKIRFTNRDASEEEDIMAEFNERGSFKFDKIYKDATKQSQIFEDIAQDLVDSALQGFNGTIFAYGQTGSGKTYTMTGGSGEPQDMGLVPRLLSYLFKQLQVREEAAKLNLRFLQIYNQNGYDLLDETAKNSKNLSDLKQVSVYSQNQGFQFANLSSHQVTTEYDAIRKFQYGDTNRIVRKTPSNDQSSRSHSIFMIQVVTKNLETGLLQKAMINLVDLAGSQRIHNSGIQDEKIAREGININLGLHMLGRVVMALGQRSKGNMVHVPYRDSLLTMALKSSMGGNCKTRMIATLNPEPKCTPEGIATCKFAMQLTSMQNNLRKNQFIDPWIIIKSLKKQVSQLKAQLELLKGAQVKQSLDITDRKRIREKVNEFIETQDKNLQLPIDDRLQIKEYLQIMRSMILKLKQGKGGHIKPLNINEDQSLISENHIKQIKHLKNLIQQRDNEINLLLNVISEKKLDGDGIDGPCLKIEDIEDKRIADGVVQGLIKKKSKQGKNISAEDVEKNLIKPFSMQKEQSMDDAFQRFKDSHFQKQAIEEKDSLLHAKQKKRQILIKKIQQLKHQRALLHTEIMKVQQNNLRRILPVKQSENETMKEQLAQIDSTIRKKYQEVKNLQIEIDRLGLGKNKNTEKIKHQFDNYVGERLRTLSQEDESEEKIKNPESNSNADKQQLKEDQVELHMQDFIKARNKLFSKQ